MTEATAPGKIILFGEHAVVYGRPAIAAPLSQVRATCTIADSPTPGIRFIAPDLDQDIWLADAPPDDPLATAVSLVKRAANLTTSPNLTLTVRSQIPIASGLGSGAAIAAAVIRALATHLNLPNLQSNAQVCALTYEVEENPPRHAPAVSTTPWWPMSSQFILCANRPITKSSRLVWPRRCAFLVADTGVRSSTKQVVGDVRRQWNRQPAGFSHIFDQCGRIATAARHAIEIGDVALVGQLMTAKPRLAAKDDGLVTRIGQFGRGCVTSRGLGCQAQRRGTWRKYDCFGEWGRRGNGRAHRPPTSWRHSHPHDHSPVASGADRSHL